MTWKAYTYHMLATNLVMALIIFIVYSFQDHLPLNQLNFPGMEALQAFNTAISFITNTNWQSYSGETTLSNFSQMGGITFPMFTSATTGFVVAMAWIRAFTVTNGGADLGNFYRDFIRFITRVLLPICFVIALVMVSQGAVQTLAASIVAHTLQGADQTIIVGPVASQGTIELVGTNGGGFYNVNAAHPFQNPTPITNVILIVLMALLPAAIIVTFGEMIGNRRQAWVLYGVMGTLMVLLLLLCVMPEQGGTPMLRQAGIETNATADQPGGNMEGKEVRFGIAGSGLFADITTAFTTGAVDSAHDSYTPLPGISMFGQMMLQCVFGGKGVGFLNGLIYGLIAVFVAGADGRPYAGVLGQKDRDAGDHSRFAGAADPSARHSFSDRLVDARSLCAVFARQQRHSRLRRSPLRIHFGRGGQRLGIRRPQLQHSLVQPRHRRRHLHRPLSADHLPDGRGGFGRPQADDAADNEHASHRHGDVRRVLVCHHPDRGRADLLPGPGSRAHCRILRHEGRPHFLTSWRTWHRAGENDGTANRKQHKP